MPSGAQATPPADRLALLDNPVALRRAYEANGDQRIADDLGVSRMVVRRARQRLGIEGRPRGRRQGVAATPTVQQGDLSPTEQAIVDRIRLWRARRVPATEETTLVAAIRGAHDARTAASPNVYDDALIDIAAAAGLIHEHRQQLRRVA